MTDGVREMTEEKATGRRSRRTSAAKAELARLLAARDEVDAATVDKRTRENAALEAFAQAQADARTIDDETVKAVAELNRQIVKLQDRAEARLVEVDRRKGAALVVLDELGRNADQIAAVTGIPVKRVRTMLREAREHGGRGDRVRAGKASATRTDASADESVDVSVPAAASGRAAEPEMENASTAV